MTQNTEQNVRTRDAQIDDLVEALSDEGWVPDHKSYCEKMILEAEARGAEEQRRKDAEGCIPVHQYFLGGFWNDCSPETYATQSHRRVLYTRPANIAALEAEIASLKEAEQLARSDAEASKARGMTLEADAARFVWLIENGGCFWYGIPGFAPVSGRTTEDRVNDLLSAIDKNMARAALTREGGV